MSKKNLDIKTMNKLCLIPNTPNKHEESHKHHCLVDKYASSDRQ